MEWKGERGAHLLDIVGQIKNGLYRRPYPSTVIIHVGTNDIFDSNTFELRKLIPSVLSSVRNLLPLTRIIWSDVLIRTKYTGEVKKGTGRKVTNFVNSQAHKAIYGMENACFIMHSAVLSPNKTSLFRGDGTHLNSNGIIVLKMSFGEALLYFNANPEEKAFPPSDCTNGIGLGGLYLMS